MYYRLISPYLAYFPLKRVLKKHAEEIAGKAALHVEGTVTEHAKQLKELIEITGAGGGGARMADLEARIAESTKGVKSVTMGMDELKEQMLEKCVAWVWKSLSMAAGSIRMAGSTKAD